MPWAEYDAWRYTIVCLHLDTGQLHVPVVIPPAKGSTTRTANGFGWLLCRPTRGEEKRDYLSPHTCSVTRNQMGSRLTSSNRIGVIATTTTTTMLMLMMMMMMMIIIIIIIIIINVLLDRMYYSALSDCSTYLKFIFHVVSFLIVTGIENRIFWTRYS
jgi:hypothetical protein